MKKTIKKVFVFAVAIAVALVITACGKIKVSEDGDGEATESPVGEAFMEPEEPAPEAVENPENSEYITGTIVYSDGATLMVCSDDYRNLNFLVAGDEVDKSGADGLVEGSMVDVYYTGVIEGNNTSAVQVTKLVQSMKQARIRTDINIVGGIVVNCDSGMITITTYNGDELTFLTGDGEIAGAKAEELESGNYVTVFYIGEIIDDNAESVTIVRLVQ